MDLVGRFGTYLQEVNLNDCWAGRYPSRMLTQAIDFLDSPEKRETPRADAQADVAENGHAHLCGDEQIRGESIGTPEFGGRICANRLPELAEESRTAGNRSKVQFMSLGAQLHEF